MVFKSLYHQILDNQNLSATDKIVYTTLIDLDNDRHCFATNKYLSKICGVCENTISRSVARLEKLNLIDVHYEKNNRRTIICQKPDGFFVKLPGHILCDDSLTPADKIIFSVIQNFDNADVCYASNEYLAKICGVSTKTISRSLAKLIECGLLAIEMADGQRILICQDNFEIAEDKKVRAIIIYNKYKELYEKKSSKYSSKVNLHVSNKSVTIHHDFNSNVKGNNIYNNIYNIYTCIDFAKHRRYAHVKPLMKSMTDMLRRAYGKTIRNHTMSKSVCEKLIVFSALFADRYYKYTGKVHPYIKTSDDTMSPMYLSLIRLIQDNFMISDLSIDDFKIVLDLFFTTKGLKNTDYNFCLFSCQGVYLRRIKEMERKTGHNYNVSVEMKRFTNSENEWYKDPDEKATEWWL